MCTAGSLLIQNGSAYCWVHWFCFLRFGWVFDNQSIHDYFLIVSNFLSKLIIIILVYSNQIRNEELGTKVYGNPYYRIFYNQTLEQMYKF